MDPDSRSAHSTLDTRRRLAALPRNGSVIARCCVAQKIVAESVRDARRRSDRKEFFGKSGSRWQNQVIVPRSTACATMCMPMNLGNIELSNSRSPTSITVICQARAKGLQRISSCGIDQLPCRSRLLLKYSHAAALWQEIKYPLQCDEQPIRKSDEKVNMHPCPNQPG